MRCVRNTPRASINISYGVISESLHSVNSSAFVGVGGSFGWYSDEECTNNNLRCSSATALPFTAGIGLFLEEWCLGSLCGGCVENVTPPTPLILTPDIFGRCQANCLLGVNSISNDQVIGNIGSLQVYSVLSSGNCPEHEDAFIINRIQYARFDRRGLDASVRFQLIPWPGCPAESLRFCHRERIEPRKSTRQPWD